MDYEAVIGLETHVQLRTKSKMWCGCANEFGAPPNTHVCPVCLGLPGVLPVANEEALRLTALAGLLLNCTVSRYAKFDRKNYFYPDMPKNYQITQYDKPSTVGGFVEFEFAGEANLKGPNGFPMVRITRAHIEEDVGKNFHFERNSGVDFNRAGVPLMEIVSEPDLSSAEMAYAYLNALKDILRHADDEGIERVSECDMEKGMVRCDVNVSVRPKGQQELGAKIEIKNMNSFSGVRKALEYEIPRQIEVLKRGGKLVQSTRRWDDVAGITEEMRTKEHAHDYRYFPEPDLMPLQPSDEWRDQVERSVWELPLLRKQRFLREYFLTAEQAEAFRMNLRVGDHFEREAKEFLATHGSLSQQDKTRYLHDFANTIIQTLHPLLAARKRAWPDLVITSSGTLALSGSFTRGEISSSTRSQIAVEWIDSGKDVQKIIEEKGRQISDIGALEQLCEQAIAANPGPAADYTAGKAAALNFLKGQVMKLSKGKANPALVGELLERRLKSSGR
ncbi:MAG TPA: Asp-tRNA(Asn)/Glu-tRNA(Gln) amidotransferase subunit GatB [Candidatus Acidoferrum sp.]|jgi:aspartyl-tRNA(Asn)/glutamyl-tRNA(Gln) amidotransferase subunit B|nr:Asp-tRNA(Asn)/Glu-tRNA(Gln) amidotransferase subunit GatB [Candidatus Acidoferrum sp.]